MKGLTKKEEFIKLRAEGISYDNICKTIGISKTTAIKWGKLLRDKVEAVEHERLEALYGMYRMTKEQRIHELGKILQGVDKALQGKDFSKLSVRSLLEYKLRYTAELAKLYTPCNPIRIPTRDLSPVDIVEALAELFNNTLDMEQKKEILEAVSRVYETNIQQHKIDELEKLLVDTSTNLDNN